MKTYPFVHYAHATRRVRNTVRFMSFLIAAGNSSPQAALLTDAESVSNQLQQESQARVLVRVRHAPVLQSMQQADWDSPSALNLLHTQNIAASEAVLTRLSSKVLSVNHRYENVAGFSCQVNAAGLDALLQDTDVLSVEPDSAREPDTRQGLPLMNALSPTRAPDVHDGRGVSIAICDTGVDYMHPQLGGAALGFNTKVIGGYSVGDASPDPAPQGIAHGTACAGTAAGNIPPAIDQAEAGDFIGGVAPGAKLYALKLPKGTASKAYDSDFIAAWDWCISHKNDNPSAPIMIISLSYGGGKTSVSTDAKTPMLYDAVAACNAAGITMFVSSGNDGFCDSVNETSGLSNTNSVGAFYDANVGTPGFYMDPTSCLPLTSANAYWETGTWSNKVCSYSNSNASLLDFFGPANNDATCDIVGAGGYTSGNYTQTFSGTSAATPYVAGAAAALQSAAKTELGHFLTPAQVKYLLSVTGTTITDWKATGVSKPKVNLKKAIESIYTFDMVLKSGNFTSGVTSPVAPGTKIDMQWNVTANELKSSKFWCEVFASKTGGFDLMRFGSTVTNSYSQPGMAALTQTIAPTDQTLKTLPDGKYTLVPSVNRGSLPVGSFINEKNYANNWLPIAGKRLNVHNTATGRWDLQPYGVTFANNLFPRGSMTVAGTVKNAGTSAVSSPGFWIEVFYGTVTAEGTFIPKGTIGSGVNISTLAAGASVPFSVVGTVAGGMTSNSLALIVDSTDIVPETNEVNNSVLRPLLPTVPKNGIDMCITGMTVNATQLAPNQISPGTKLTYTVTVANKGVVPPAPKIWLELFASQDGGVSFVRGSTLTAGARVQLPGVGKSQTYSFEQAVNAIGDGMYTPVAVVNRIGAGTNPGDENPTDNRYAYAGGRVSISTQAQILGWVNLVWSQGPTFAYKGKTVTVTGKVKNTGLFSSSPFWTEAFIGRLESPTGIFIRENVLSSGVLCTGLAAGAEQSILISGTVAAGKVVGVLADSTDLVSESDETDNYDYSSLTK